MGEGLESFEKEREWEADEGLCGIDAVIFGIQVEADGKRFVYRNYYAYKTSAGDPSSYIEILKCRATPVRRARSRVSDDKHCYEESSKTAGVLVSQQHRRAVPVD